MNGRQQEVSGLMEVSQLPSERHERDEHLTTGAEAIPLARAQEGERNPQPQIRYERGNGCDWKWEKRCQNRDGPLKGGRDCRPKGILRGFAAFWARAKPRTTKQPGSVKKRIALTRIHSGIVDRACFVIFHSR